MPLSAEVLAMYGIDFSEPMLAELQKKAGSGRISLTLGDMTNTTVCDDASLVCLDHYHIDGDRGSGWGRRRFAMSGTPSST